MILFATLFLHLASSAAAEAPTALVWLPPENYRRWSEVDALLRDRSGLKLTIGLTPSMASPLVKAALKPWVENGRVELAARVDGDPVLALIAAHPEAPRPQEPVERAVTARSRLEKRLGLAPAGFVPGAGALDPATAASLGAAGAAWVLAGPYATAESPWAASGGTVFVPSSSARIFDETASSSSTFAADYPATPRPAAGWTTAGELAKSKMDAPAPLDPAAAWPAWDAEAAQAPSEEGPKAAWDAYGAAAAAVDRYQNSGSADLRTLDAAVEALRRAQAAKFYRPGGPAELPAELRSALLAVYKRLKLPAPDALYGEGRPGGPGTARAAEERPTGVKALSGPSWLEFRAPAGAMALRPSAAGASTSAAVSDGGAAADPWRIRSLRVDWDDAAVRITLKVSSAFSGPPKPVYEIYADFNHVLGAGRVALLEGRGAVVQARDAWELALAISGSDARLYRARGGGEPEETAVFKAEWAADRGEVSVAVPRASMRGNPARWGWAAVAFAEDPARAGRRPAAALVNPDGTILLGALVPADVQKAILSRANPRVPAARLEP